MKVHFKAEVTKTSQVHNIQFNLLLSGFSSNENIPRIVVGNQNYLLVPVLLLLSLSSVA